MRIDYEPNLIEHVIFEAGHRDPKLEAEIHQLSDPVYDLCDQRERNARFEELYKTLFQQLKLDEVILQLLAERKLIEKHVSHLIVREAISARKESAELYVKCDDDEAGTCTQTIIIRVCAVSLLTPDQFKSRMRRELLQIADMIDQRFGYRKDSLTGKLPHDSLIRDRYRVVWELYTQGRIDRQGHRDQSVQRILNRQFERVFSGYPADVLSSARGQIAEADNLTHDQLLQWAADPQRLMKQDSKPHQGSHPAPGETCPLCRFSTYDWFDQDRDRPELRLAIRRDFPQWQPEQGLCRQCAEIYRPSSL